MMMDIKYEGEKSEMNKERSGSDDDGEGEHVVKLRGLPWSATKEDILDFFSACRIHKGRDGIHLVTNPEGRSSGEAFVELPPEEDITNFTKKDKETMGARYIEVFKVKKAEMDWFLRRSRPGQQSNSTFRGSEDSEAFLRLRGLPFECTKEDIQDFFKGLEIVPNGIQLMVDSYGRSSGESYVQFTSTSEADKAYKTKDKQSIGHRYVEIFRVGPAELRSIQMLGRPSGGGRSTYGNNRMNPYDRGGAGRDRDSRYGGGGGGGGRPARYYSKGFEEDSWNNYGGGNDNGGWNRGGGSGPPPLMPGLLKGGGRGLSGGGGFSKGGGQIGGLGGGGPRSKHCVLMRGLPFKAAEDDIRSFFDPLVPTAVHIIYESSGRPSGTAKVEFASNDDVTRAMAKHKERMEHRYIELFVHSV